MHPMFNHLPEKSTYTGIHAGSFRSMRTKNGEHVAQFNIEWRRLSPFLYTKIYFVNGKILHCVVK